MEHNSDLEVKRDHGDLEVVQHLSLEVAPNQGSEMAQNQDPEVAQNQDLELAQNQNLQLNNGQDAYTYNELPTAANTPSSAPGINPDKTTSQVRKPRSKRFWLIAGASALALIAAIAVVAGVLGSQLASARNTSPSKDSSASSSTSPSSTPASNGAGSTTAFTNMPTTVPSFSSVTSFSSSVTYSGTAYPVEQSPVMATLSAGGTTTFIDCPYSNNTVYEDATTGVRFLRRCGANVVSNDITSFTAYSLEDCMTRCARSRAEGTDCSAVVWIWGWNGFVNTDMAEFNYCYLKSSKYNVPSNLYWNWQAELAFIIP